MSTFMDDPGTVEVAFDDGVIFTLKKYMDAGVQEDIENSMARMEMVEGPAVNNGQSTNGGGHSSIRAIQIRMGDLEKLRLMTLRIERPGGQTQRYPNIGMQTFRRLSRPALVRLLDTIEENNPPLGDLRNKLEVTEVVESLTPGMSPLDS